VRPNHRLRRRAELVQLVKLPGPLDNTPTNRNQRRIAAGTLRRMARKPAKGGSK
jgi:hypothetical protein